MQSIRIENVKTDSFSMDYIRFGHGEGVFVIIPGLSVQSVMPLADMVADAYKILTEDYTVYMFDRIKDLPEVYTVRDMARDTAAAMRELGLKDVVLYGASQGGMISSVIALENPDLISRLVLASTAASIDENVGKVVKKWKDLASEGKAEELYLSFGEDIYPKEVFEQSKGLLTDAAKTVTKEELDRFVILASGMEGFDVLGDIGKISCPVFLMGSSDDRVLGSEASMKIAEKFKGREDFLFHMYEGYGHSAYDTAPDYKERILKFLKGLSRG